MQEENRLLEHLPHLGDLQVSWLLLYFCAANRANHIIRLLPPNISDSYAEMHDRAKFQCLEGLLQIPGAVSKNFQVEGIASLPCCFGGLGLRDARRTATATYWAAWADALPILIARLPELGNKLDGTRRAAKVRRIVERMGNNPLRDNSHEQTQTVEGIWPPARASEGRMWRTP